MSLHLYSKRTNLIGLLIALALALACLLFVVPAILADNPLFAFDTITARPTHVTVYDGGEATTFYPDSEEYDVLVEAAYQTLYNEIGLEESGWSSLRFEQARAEGLAVELFYDEPVRIPGKRVDIADTYRLFFPLDVFGWDSDVVFRGGRNLYWGLPVRVDTLDRLREAVAQLETE